MNTQTPAELQISKAMARTARYRDDFALNRRRRYTKNALYLVGCITFVSLFFGIAFQFVPKSVLDTNPGSSLTLIALIGLLILSCSFGWATTWLEALTPVSESGKCQQALDLVNSSTLAGRVRDDVLAMGRQLHGWDLTTMAQLYELETREGKKFRQLAAEDVACKLLYRLSEPLSQVNLEKSSATSQPADSAAAAHD